MTNTQLYLAIGIPMLVLIAAMVMSILHMSGIRGDLYGIRGEIRQTRSDIDKLSRQIEDSARGPHASTQKSASIQTKKD